MYDDDAYQEKTVKIGKKVKMKTLKQVVELCIINKLPFEFGSDGSLSVESNGSYESTTFEAKHFGSTFNIKTADISFCQGKVDVVTYHTNKVDIVDQFAIFFNKFPKLTKEQKKAPVVPPKPKVLMTLPAGKGHKHYDMDFLDNNILTVGCNEFDLGQVKKIHDFLGKVLKDK